MFSFNNHHLISIEQLARFPVPDVIFLVLSMSYVWFLSLHRVFVVDPGCCASSFWILSGSPLFISFPVERHLDCFQLFGDYE